MLRRLFIFVTVVTICLLNNVARAQEENKSSSESCADAALVSVPSRPTVSNATDTTLCGVVEAEYGLERQWPGGGTNREDLTGGLRLGILHNLDFHWQSSDFLHIMDPSGDRTGFGDTWLGLKYRFLTQTKDRPSMGVFYQIKVPSASDVLGLGTGKVDHSLSFLFSKDIHPAHFDFNIIPFFAGSPTRPGFDHNVGFALSGSVPLFHKLGLVGEGYGYTELNQNNPAFASTMLGFTYHINSRFILDTGFDQGVTHSAPHKRVFVGFTYALTNISAWRKRHS